MESRIIIFHTKDNRQMAFRQLVRPERWNIILKPLSDIVHRALIKGLGEEHFDNDFTVWVNEHVIGLLIALATFNGTAKERVIRAAREIFEDEFLLGLEKAVHDIDKNLTIPFPELYMKMDMEALPSIPNFQRLPILFFKDKANFDRVWPSMRKNLDFLITTVLKKEVDLDEVLDY